LGSRNPTIAKFKRKKLKPFLDFGRKSRKMLSFVDSCSKKAILGYRKIRGLARKGSSFKNRRWNRKENYTWVFSRMFTLVPLTWGRVR